MGVDLNQAFRALFDDEGFVAASVDIVSSVKDDLAAGQIRRPRVDAQFDAVARAIKKLSPPAEELLLINLNKVCGDVELGRATYYNFLDALYQDTRDLKTRARTSLVSAVYRVFRQHSLPIDQRPEGLLSRYYGRVVAATGAPWPVEQLTRETYGRHKDGGVRDLV